MKHIWKRIRDLYILVSHVCYKSVPLVEAVARLPTVESDEVSLPLAAF
jgi:hypothetical protein